MAMEFGFRPHLMLDCYGCSKERLSDVDFINNLLDFFPEKLGMSKIAPPNVFKYHGAVNDDWGLSGVVLSGGAHISIHTFPDKEYAFIDIFSSEDFDIDVAKNEMIKCFNAKQHEVTMHNHRAEAIKDLVSV
jgi:S-adenosylmethionine decarboxylase